MSGPVKFYRDRIKIKLTLELCCSKNFEGEGTKVYFELIKSGGS